VKALLEGIGYNLRWIFENYRRDFGFNPLKFRAIGGGSVNREWMQGIADITGMRVETTSQPTMAGAIGVATCAFVGKGTFGSFSDVTRYIQVKETFEPNPATKEVYNALFSSYKNVYSGLKKAYNNANLDRFGAI
jgi:xylulokinase